MGKHAYLIIAHNNFELLKNLIELLSDPRNDIFLHLDKKSDRILFRNTMGDTINIVETVEPVSVVWGGYSQIVSEMRLIEAAVNKDHYDYLHLISGVDLPIKSQGYIHDFFERHKGKEFIYFDQDGGRDSAIERTRYYYPFQDIIGRKKSGLLFGVQRYVLAIQRRLGLKRNSELEKYAGKGSNWFSITGDFAEYVAKKKDFIKKHFNYTRCADEVFLHMLFKMSGFCDRRFTEKLSDDEIFYTNMRCFDWKRGNPYVFKNEDLPMLVKSPYLFARKFDEEINIKLLKELIENE